MQLLRASRSSGANRQGPSGKVGVGKPRGVVSKLSSLEELFAERHFDRQVIILCVRWYLRYKLRFPVAGQQAVANLNQ
jgi:hypothetical protein